VGTWTCGVGWLGQSRVGSIGGVAWTRDTGQRGLCVGQHEAHVEIGLAHVGWLDRVHAFDLVGDQLTGPDDRSIDP
jgi:hypothetical protein